MEKACVILFQIFAAVVLAEMFFYRHIKNKRDDLSVLNKKIKESITAYFIIVSLFVGWLYFGEDRAVYVECRRETTACVYMRSTEFNKTLRPSKTYDISRVQTATVKQRHRKRSSYYVIELWNGIDDRFELPMEFNSKRHANRETKLLNDFLQNKKNAYTFVKQPDSTPFQSIVLFFSSFFGIILALRLFWDLLAANSGKLRGKKEPEISEVELRKLREQMKKDGLTDEEIDDILNDTGETPVNEKSAGETSVNKTNILPDLIQRTRRD